MSAVSAAGYKPAVRWVSPKTAATLNDCGNVRQVYDWVRRGAVLAKLIAGGRALRVAVDDEGTVIDGPGAPPPWVGVRFSRRGPMAEEAA